MSLIAHVVPILRLPRRIGFFDYEIPDAFTAQLRPGHRVRISFKGRSIGGIVWSISDTSEVSRALKPIELVVDAHPLLSEQDRVCIEWFAEYHAISRGHALQVVIGRLYLRDLDQSPLVQTGTPPLAREVHAPSFWPTDNRAHTLFLYDHLADKEDLYSYLAAQASHTHANLLLLCSSVREARRLAHVLEQRTGTHCGLITGDTTPIQEGKILTALRNGSLHVLVGTRTALCIPLPHCTTIILDDSERTEYKQYDQNPRYDSRTVARKRAELLGAQLILSSTAPRLEEIADMRTGILLLIDRRTPCTLPLINVRDEWRGGRSGFVSERLSQEIQATLNTKKSAVLFLNRKGTSKMVVCRDCEYSHTCPSCGALYSYSQKTHQLSCPTCPSSEPLPTSCPQCKSVRMKFPGLGIEKILAELRVEFPNVPLIECTKDSSRDISVRELLEHLDTNPPAIIVGTSYLFLEYPHIFAQCGLVGTIAIDPMLSPTDFRSLEYQWQTLSTLRMLALSSNAHIIVQTFNPENTFVHQFASGKDAEFFAAQIDERQSYQWPPHSTLVRLIGKRGVQSTTITESLKRAIDQCNELGVSVHSFPFRQKGTITHGLIRVSSRTAPQPITDFLNALPQDWLVDREPLEF